ncbi:DUF2381 family protein [Corallococcus aberystwythensis]|uniref:DUF2381 family protein n=1 Tax=Corallococcus aberystwythensis TaxID=2316722 RepID=A0A3A8PHW5_9BACT|nr:DUF2381 family protein [Corallococcus aberystwythensis]RKH55609.1 DUF2381 family protein [Corallococcus aberystwythensis]
MSSSSFVVFLGLLLVSGASVAQSEAAASSPGVRRIELAPDDALSAPEIAISAGLSTTLLFDSNLKRDEVELESRDRFSLVDVGQATLRLVPSARLIAGERLRLVVRFRDGAAPASASFFLRVHPAKAEPLIEVYRGMRTIETYQQEAREVRAELMRCQSEVARLLAEQNAPSGLAGLVSSSALDEHGVTGRVVTTDVAQTTGNANAFKVASVKSYRSATGVAVEINLKVKAGAPPWVAKGATLRGKSGAELKVLRLWQQRPIPIGEFGVVVVEAEASEAASRGTFSIKLWEEDGPRTVVLGNLMFP